MQAQKLTSVIFSSRLKIALDKAGLNQKQLAERCGVTQPAVYRWMKGSIPKVEQAVAIGKALNTDYMWLLGIGTADNSGIIPLAKENASLKAELEALRFHQSALNADSSNPNKTKDSEQSVLSTSSSKKGSKPVSNASLSTTPLRRIPVVSWASAGPGGNYSDLAEQINETVLCDCPDPNSYALIIEGDSMMPKFEPGDRCVFMPNSEAQNGDVVCARLMKDGEVMFKLFHACGPRGETVRLTSFNPAYPPLEYPRASLRFIHPMHSVVRRWNRR